MIDSDIEETFDRARAMGLSYHDLHKLTGIAVSTLRRWRTANGNPQMSKLGAVRDAVEAVEDLRAAD
jgi:transcriptional regulator with XRE-family HTH domain